MFPPSCELSKHTCSSYARAEPGSHAPTPKIGTNETIAKYRSPSATSWSNDPHDSQRPDLHHASSVYNRWRRVARRRAAAGARRRGLQRGSCGVAVQVVSAGGDHARCARVAHARSERSKRTAHRSRDRHEVSRLPRGAPEKGFVEHAPV